MTPTTLAETILRDVPRYLANNAGEIEPYEAGYLLMEDEVLAAITAAMDPAIAERAGEVLEGVTLHWDRDGRKLHMDQTMAFSKSYDWDGWDCFRQEGYGDGANYIIWPDSIGSEKWNLYGTADGLFITDLDGEIAAKTAAQKDYEAHRGGPTSGPWRIGNLESYEGDTGVAFRRVYFPTTEEGEIQEAHVRGDNCDANARFIAWCREGVPALLAQNAALRAERDRVAAINVKHCESVNTLLIDGARLEDQLKAAEAQNAALTARVEGLTEALESIANDVDLMATGRTSLLGKMGRTARAALSTTEEGHDPQA